MASKTQPVIPPTIQLETIYEESGSSLSTSIVDIHHQSRHRQQSSTYSPNQTTHGLISARSIPSVDVHRRRQADENQEKPPIEVRYRDGSKLYIHPSTTTMIMNRRKSYHSSRQDSSSSSKTNTKYRQIFNVLPKKKKSLPKNPQVLLTIITADDLNQAGITPSSISSPDDSDTSTFTQSQSTLSTIQDTSLKDADEVPIERLPMVTVLPSIPLVQPVIDISTSNLRFPIGSRHRSPQQQQQQQQLRYSQQVAAIRSQSLSPSQSHLSPSVQNKPTSNQLPPVAIVPPSPKKSQPSLQITLTNDENERQLSSKANLSNTTTRSSSKSANETVNNEYKYSIRSSNRILVGDGSRSAFRPFLKQTARNSQPGMPLSMNVRPPISTNQLIQNSSQRQQSIVPSSHLPYQPTTKATSISNGTNFTLQPSITINPTTHDRRSNSSDTPKQTVNSIISKPILSDKMMNSTSQKISSHQQQSVPKPIINNSAHKPNFPEGQVKNAQNVSITVDPNLQWHSITSKSLYEVPRLSNQYSDIPLRITLPVRTPTHNQKLVVKHDIALEKRLLDAGLSPETIALYERILEVADIPQMGITSPPEITDQYSCESLL